MRCPRDPQQELHHVMPKNNVGQELSAMSAVRDDNRELLELLYQDLIGLRRADPGRTGLSAEPVRRGAILKPYRQLTYEELGFHLEDSESFQALARLKMGQYPSDSTWQENIKAISAATWAADRGFARQANLATAQRVGVQDVMFAKKRGLRLLEMVKSLWVYKKRRNFRAGMEATISRLKRTFGSDLCTWWGGPGFRQYVWIAIISYNIMVLGRWLAQPS